MTWKVFALMAIGMLKSAGIAKVNEDDNDTGSDDLIGNGLVYAAQFLEWLLSDRAKPAPTFKQK